MSELVRQGLLEVVREGHGPGRGRKGERGTARAYRLRLDLIAALPRRAVIRDAPLSEQQPNDEENGCHGVQNRCHAGQKGASSVTQTGVADDTLSTREHTKEPAESHQRG